MSGLSIVLPTYNSDEELCARLPVLRRSLAPHFRELEFIVVDDASPSVTKDLRAVVPNVRVLRNRVNLGKGASVLLGIHAARHDRVLFTDGDIPFDAESYVRVAEKLQTGHGIVIGCRRRSESQILVSFDALRHVALRHIVGLSFNKAVRALTGLSQTDTQCGLKAFDRATALELFRHVRSPRFLFDIELLLAARARGMHVSEVPVCVVYEDARSSVRIARGLWPVGRGLFGIWARLRSGEFGAEPRSSLLERVLPLSDEVAAQVSP